MNPFTQGWSNPPFPNATHSVVPRGSTPSAHGFLPNPHAPPPPLAPNPMPTLPNLITFSFSSPCSSVLNSIVTGPQSQRYFRITTDSTTGGFSIVQNTRQESVAMIEWRKHPVVEIIGQVSKTNSAKWLALSPDKSCRLVTAKGYHFGWMPDGRYIALYGASQANPGFYGRISQSPEGTSFDMTAEALQLGLLEVFVVSALLLMCGRNID